MEAGVFQYLCFGRELAESGTPHLQGYARARFPSSHSWFRDRLPGCHVEFAKGTFEQAIAYCEKDGSFVEFGERPANAKKKGELAKEAFERTRDLAKRGCLDEVEPEHFIKYYRTLTAIKKDYMAKPSDESDVTGVWYYGLAGAGKSRKARDDYPAAYFKMANKWWDGYQNEEYVILDDLDPKHECLAHHLKIWSDRYSFIAECKGGAIHIRPKKIIVTSQYSIDDIWADEETREALHRRFHTTHILNYAGRIQPAAQPDEEVHDVGIVPDSEAIVPNEIFSVGRFLSQESDN